MIYPAEKKEKERQHNNFGANIKPENNRILHAVYKKVPAIRMNEFKLNAFSIEMHKRQYEEQIRAKYAIKKEKTGGFI